MTIKKLKIYLDNAKCHNLLIIVFSHLIVVSLTFIVLILNSKKSILPNNINVLNFDAYFYYSIKDIGYLYEPNVGNNLAFFPMFPLIWKLFAVSPIGISMINLLIFLSSFWFLLKNEIIDRKVTLLLLSIPSLIFCCLPYSESLFFLFGVLILLGYSRKSKILLFFGFLGASMLRSVCMIFIPAIILCELFIDTSTPIRQRFLSMFAKLVATLTGFFIAVIYMGYYTGKWFYFIEIQKFWHRHWATPDFPLTTLSPQRVLGIDAIAFTIGCLSIYFILKHIYSAIYDNNRKNLLEPNVFFSTLYLAGMTILDTFFTYSTNHATNIWSINRHLMCTPFAIIFIIYLYKNFQPSKYEYIGILIIILIEIFATGIYQYSNLLPFYVLFFSIILFFKSKWSNYLFVAYYLSAVFIQLSFYNDFLFGRWVG